MLQEIISKLTRHLKLGGTDSVFPMLLGTFRTTIDEYIDTYQTRSATSLAMQDLDPGSINILMEYQLGEFRSTIDDFTIRYHSTMSSIGANPRTRAIYQRETRKFQDARERALKNADEYLAIRLRQIGEGYSLFKKMGHEDPLKDLGITILDYVDIKLQKIQDLLQKNITQGVALGYHFAEILQVGNQYGIDIAGIIGSRATAIAYVRNLTGRNLSESQVKTYLREMQQKAHGDLSLSPWSNISLKMEDLKT